MPTRHDPPRARDGELTTKGKKARRFGAPAKRQRGIDPQRLRVVADMMAGAVDYYSMQVTLSERWNVSMRQIRNYHARVLVDMRDELADAGYMDPGLEQVLGVRRLEEIYLRAMAEKDFRTAHGVVRTRMMVAGVLGPERHVHHHQVTGNVTATIHTPAEAALAARKELVRRLAGAIVRATVLPPKETP